MNKDSPLYDDEIDLIALFKIIWDGKIKILFITIISFLVGLGYNSQIPINYLNSLTINPSKNINFMKSDNIRQLIKSNQSNQSNLSNQNLSNLSNLSNQSNQSNQSNLSNLSNQVRFINELEDYEEFLLSVRNSKKFQESISKLNIEDQEIELVKYVKLLEIVEPKKNKDKYIINFKWHDPKESKKILQETLNLTSKNLKEAIDLELSQLLEFKKKKLTSIESERINYLKEQSAIAKELNILDNQIDSVNLSQSSVSLNINTADIAYYLRGYKAIDAEIKLIENRDHQYLKSIEQALNDFKDIEIEFVRYNVNLMDHNLLINSKLNLMISILLGLIVGLLYVLISNAFQLKKVSKKTN